MSSRPQMSNGRITALLLGLLLVLMVVAALVSLGRPY